MEYWHYFYAGDYKGGELHCCTNLSARTLIESLVEMDWDFEMFEDYEAEEESEELNLLESTNPAHRKLLVDIFNSWYESESNGDTYAGYTGRTFPEVYFTTPEGRLEEGFPDDEVVADIMFNYLGEYMKNGETR